MWQLWIIKPLQQRQHGQHFPDDVFKWIFIMKMYEFWYIPPRCESPANVPNTQILPVSLTQVEVEPKWGKSTDRDQNHINFESGRDTVSIPNFRSWLPCALKKMPRNLKFDQLHKSKWSRSNHFWKQLGYISMLNFRPFLICILKKMPWKPLWKDEHI